MSDKNQPPDFESSLAELEDIVRQMEKGDMTLDNSLLAFERGVRLSNHCQQTLKNAQQKVNRLVGADEKMTFEPFAVESSAVDPSTAGNGADD
ncbi:MAG: exodeoxyribonuclease VII small subunit [Proteobacteria bacterium]|nr:MAG: exodeoxyribonuclease VII small subunit [Pseudomonadota bacterium]